MSNDTKKTSGESQDEVRLNVFLQESGVASRRKADELIEAGMVKVNGKSVTQLGTRIRRSDKVHVHGKLIGAKSIPRVVFLLNKPDMCLTTRFDAKGRRTIFDLPSVKVLPPNVQAVGRLDYRSEGLLLLTNDGDLAYALTHPRFSVEKSYAVLVADGVTIEDVEKLRAGVLLDDGLAKAVSVRLGNKERLGVTRGQWLELVVTEGRNRLIRRMAEAIGLKVVRLVRVGMGDVLLPATLKEGHAIAVDAAARSHLEQIKNDMLKTLGSDRAEDRAGRPDESTMAKRKIRRQLKLNDEEYQIESSRRSAEASMKRKQRSQKQREVLQTKNEGQRSVGKPEQQRPVPRSEQPRTASRSDQQRPVPRSEQQRPVPRSEQPRPVPRSEQPRPVPRSEQRDEGVRSGPRRMTRDKDSKPKVRSRTSGENSRRKTDSRRPSAEKSRSNAPKTGRPEKRGTAKKVSRR
jgi:pseudouridine synthase